MIFSKKQLCETLILNDVKIKTSYGSAKIGKLWIAIKPLIQVVFIGFVFNKVVLVDQENHTAFIMYNLLMLNFISSSLSFSTKSIYESSSIIARFNVNKNTFPFSTVFNGIYIYFFCLLVCSVVVGVFDSIPLHFNMIFAPIYFMYIVVVMMFVCSSFALIYPYFQDIGFLTESVCMIAMWITPIFYPISQMPEWMFKLSYFNPFFILIAPFTRLLHQGLFPTQSMHLAMFGLFMVSFGLYLITQKKLSRNVIYYC